MPITRKQLALIHVAKSKVGLSEEGFRSAVAELGGVASTKDLDKSGFETLMAYFEWLGFEPLRSRGVDFGERPGMASFGQITLIRTLWSEYTRQRADEEQLNKWLRNKWQIDSLRFLTGSQAPKVITALKAMKARAA